MKKIIFYLSIYSVLLVVFRVFVTNSLFYVFMIWNLFLAFIPYFISSFIHHYSSNKIIFFFIPWLLFLPNAPYILTDLFHLQQGNLMPIWFDLLLLLTFSVTGMLLYFISLKQMYDVLAKKYSLSTSNFVIYSCIFLSSFGIYLGRYLRWNSWEIISHPIKLFQDILQRFINPLAHPKTWGITVGYSILFVILFWFIKNIKISFTFAENKAK